MSNQIKSDYESVDASNIISLEALSIQKHDRRSKREEFSRWVRCLLQNWRQGTVACKGRSDVVSRSNKKPWKQKGTGRARAGSARSPLWRGGGVTFGPKERIKRLYISKKVKHAVLYDLVHSYVEQKRVLVVDWSLSNNQPRTASVYAELKKMGLAGKKIVIFVAFENVMLQASLMNIPTAKIVFFDQVNAFDLAYASNWVVLKKDFDLFKKMVSGWM